MLGLLVGRELDSFWFPFTFSFSCEGGELGWTAGLAVCVEADYLFSRYAVLYFLYARYEGHGHCHILLLYWTSLLVRNCRRLFQHLNHRSV